MTEYQKTTADSLVAAMARARKAGLRLYTNEFGSTYVCAKGDIEDVRQIHQTNKTGHPKNVDDEDVSGYVGVAELEDMPLVQVALFPVDELP